MTYSNTGYGYDPAPATHPVTNPDDVTPADISHTRAEMSDTLAALGEKLNPHHLAEEAKEAVVDAVKDTANHAKDTAVEIVQHLRDTLPEVVSEAAHHFVHGIVHESKTVWNGAVGNSKDALGGAVTSAKGASMSVLDNIKQNPLAAGLVGVGLYMLFKNNGATTKSASIPAVGYTPNTGYNPGGTSFPVTGYNASGVADAAQSAGSAISDAASTAAGKVSDAAGQVQDAAGNLVHQVQDKTSQVAGQVQSTLSDAAGTVQDKAQTAVQAVQGSAQASTDFFQRSLQENPLAVGGVAIAVGMAIALAIPETAPEHKLMGAAKDNLVQKAADAAHGLGDKISSVATDTMNSVKESAHNQGLTA